MDKVEQRDGRKTVTPYHLTDGAHNRGKVMSPQRNPFLLMAIKEGKRRGVRQQELSEAGSHRSIKMVKKVAIKWRSEPEEHDYPAAQSYLSLLYDEQTANAHVEKLRRAPRVEFKAKDIFRASALSLLGISNAHVEKDRQKIRSGQALSPLLLIRDSGNRKVIIADGYHRLCAVYSYDEDAGIPCQIA
jgi:hypothetical protein